MRKDSTTAKLTKLEIQRNKAIAKIQYIACPIACHNPSVAKILNFLLLTHYAAFCNTSRKCIRSFRTASLAPIVRVS